MVQDEPGESVMTAQAMASAMVRVYGENALGAVRRHIARCLEDNLIDDLEFWLRVRNQVEHLQWKEIRGERSGKRPAGTRRSGEEIVLAAWLKDALSRMAGSVADEPIPEELLRLLDAPMPPDDPS
ncbi:hypothetical protein HLH36_07410 [Gluconacetobacter aggeris]|uniref:Uncharacterized protein n=1 Tax=Gluconacetobacter aggeris TaxID=1286186 RepID=A0A7W4ISE1_9PROT|nr:hypothetical protein [Gluconacetobacter aggeris]MBB2168181.1 hypothetical protein [Gluconacetobacter aggeris]